MINFWLIMILRAGFDWETPFNDQKENKEILLWDRELFAAAAVYKRYGKRIDEFSEIFIGHTPHRLCAKVFQFTCRIYG